MEPVGMDTAVDHVPPLITCFQGWTLLLITRVYIPSPVPENCY
jgi:hypothetical protein